MKNKFLFTEEWVGTEMWNKRNEVVKKYFEVEEDPFVKGDCGFSKADFDMMLDALKRAGVEI